MIIYFNKDEFLKALSYIDTNPILCKERMENYLTNYPEDYSGYNYYLSVLITLGLFKEAEEGLKFIESVVLNEPESLGNLERQKNVNRNFIFTKSRLLCYQEKYLELDKLLEENQDLEVDNMEFIRFYAKLKSGHVNIPRQYNPYLYKQIIQYKESDFRKHIEKHLESGNKDLEERNNNIFVEEFPIDKIIEEIKKYIPSSTCLYPGFFEDIYVFKYDNCGKDNGKMVNYFKVTALHNTQEFITMFPAKDSEHLPSIDLNYLKYENTEKEKVKVISQIDKFNKRFKR